VLNAAPISRLKHIREWLNALSKGAQPASTPTAGLKRFLFLEK
jgi:hypothetical protein